MRWIALGFMAALTASPIAAAKAPAGPTRAEIAEARSSLQAAADEVFVNMWPQFADDMSRDNVSSAALRSAGKWMILGYSLGLCRSLVSERLMADWMTAYDLIRFGYGPRADEAQVRFRSYGLGQVAKGQADKSYGADGSASQRRLCRAEIAAVDELLDTPL